MELRHLFLQSQLLGIHLQIAFTVYPHIVLAETILFEFGKQYISPKVTVHKSAETIQGKKLYEEIWYVIPWSQMPLFIELILDRFLIIF